MYAYVEMRTNTIRNLKKIKINSNSGGSSPINNTQSSRKNKHLADFEQKKAEIED